MGAVGSRRTVGFPATGTSFVGRRHELTQARRLLTATRLLTLTGPGGVGKTRLAGRVAEGAVRGFPDGVWLVPLAAVRDGTLVPHAVADALGIRDEAGRAPLDTVVEHLRTRRLLLVLDNCEHVAGACASLVAAVLGATEGARVLATSRHRLGLPEERLLPVAPLATPAPGDDLPGTDFPALRLFADRAAAVAPGFEITDSNRAAVARLCHRLDGLPLAIELAAVRMHALGVEQLDERLGERLGDRYRLLTSGSPAAPPRHQTLRSAVDWSHDLCTPEEQLTWSHLSVFTGSFDLAGAEAVCGALDGRSGGAEGVRIGAESAPTGPDCHAACPPEPAGPEHAEGAPSPAGTARVKGWADQPGAVGTPGTHDGPPLAGTGSGAASEPRPAKATHVDAEAARRPDAAHTHRESPPSATVRAAVTPIRAGGEAGTGARTRTDAVGVDSGASQAAAGARRADGRTGRPNTTRPYGEPGPGAHAGDEARAETVGMGSCAARAAVLDAVTGLVEKSVLVREDGGGGVRYRMLGLLREYGLEKLAAGGEAGDARRRLCAYFVRVAEEHERGWFGPDQPGTLAGLRAEHDNLRAALDFCLTTPGESPRGLRLVGSLWFYWIARGAWAELRHWWQRLALREGGRPSPELTRAHWAAALIPLVRSRTNAVLLAGTPYPPTLAPHEIPDVRPLADVLGEHTGDDTGPLLAFHILSRVEMATTLTFHGRPERAVPLCLDALAVCEAHGEQWVHSYVLGALATARWALGEHEAAAESARRCLRLPYVTGEPHAVGGTLEILAVATAARGDTERAAVLRGAAHRIWYDLGHDPLAGQRQSGHLPATEHRTHETLGDGWYGQGHGYEYGEAHRRGYELSAEEALAYALGEADTAAETGRAAAENERPAPATGHTSAGTERAASKTGRASAANGRAAPGTGHTAAEPGRTSAGNEPASAGNGRTTPGTRHTTAEPGPTSAGNERTAPGTGRTTAGPGPTSAGNRRGPSGAGHAARAASPTPPAPPARPALPVPPAPDTGLTRRELEVAALIASGMTNRQIAERLVISRRTAEGHVERILAKLGFAGRSQVAAWFSGPPSR